MFRDSWAEAGVERRAFPAPRRLKPAGDAKLQNELGAVSKVALVKAITEEVLRRLNR